MSREGDVQPASRAEQLPTGSPRVHWLETDHFADLDRVIPAGWLVRIERVWCRTSADGQGDVWIEYTLVESS